MTSAARLSLCFVLAFLLSGTAVQASETTVDTPSAHVYTGSAGTVVTAPGVSINIPTPQLQPAQGATVPAVVPIPVQAVVAQAPAVTSYANASLPGMDFSNQNLVGADFSNATLTGARFAGANLEGAQFSNASLQNVDFTGADLKGVKLTNTTLDGANLTNTDLTQADLTNASLNRTIVANTRFAGAILTNVNMGQVIHVAAAAPLAPAPRPVLVDADAISTALMTSQKKIDLTINFDFNSDKLTADGLKQVEQVAHALLDIALSNSRIMVEGHTDNVGGEKYNKDLSYRRATRVMQTLVDQYGVQPARLSAQGFGKAKPIASNDNDLGRAMNRRVTLVNLGE